MGLKLAAKLFLILFSAAGCLFAGTTSLAGESAGGLSALPNCVQALGAAGVSNVFRLGPHLMCGSAPEGEAGFQALAQLGIRSIITVDGAKPDVEAAHRFGMHYVHIPHGYDGIDTKTQAALAKAARSVTGPIYIHCHHGLHRGPAAAAVICLANENWTSAQAEALLARAGTATNYVGLYEAVRRFRPLTSAELQDAPDTFPETAATSSLVDLMVAVDERWDHLKAVRKADYRSPRDNPDIQPEHEALLLREQYREAQRLSEAVRRGDDFMNRLAKAEEAAGHVENLLRSARDAKPDESRAALNAAFNAMGQSCTTCHQKYRDPDGINFRK